MHPLDGLNHTRRTAGPELPVHSIYIVSYCIYLYDTFCCALLHVSSTQCLAFVDGGTYQVHDNAEHTRIAAESSIVIEYAIITIQCCEYLIS